MVCEIRVARTSDPLTTRLSEYYHTDLLGSTRMMSDGPGSPIVGSEAAYTAFGELVGASAAYRFGYAGAYGYQHHQNLPFLHVGVRYYDPATGRFLQRDPIGVAGGLNVYEYVRNAPTARVDPDGMYPFGGFPGYQPPPPKPKPKPKPPRPKPPKPEPPKPKPPKPHPTLPGPLGPIHRIKATLILAGPGMVGACVGDCVMTVAGVPLWYDGEGGEWFYCIKRVAKEIKETW